MGSKAKWSNLPWCVTKQLPVALRPQRGEVASDVDQPSSTLNQTITLVSMIFIMKKAENYTEKTNEIT